MRVASAENKSNLDSQAERLIAYCAARGYQVAKVVKEVGSGINDARPKLLALLAENASA
jgi:putative resolvase